MPPKNENGHKMDEAYLFVLYYYMIIMTDLIHICHNRALLHNDLLLISDGIKCMNFYQYQ